MGLNETPSANRPHIAFFGRRNAGKSSLVNAVTGQNLALVSSVKGTTTDPVYKAMELLPLGPVVIIDTPGFDDEGELGEMRVEKTKQVLNKTDIAVLVLDGEIPTDTTLPIEDEIINLFKFKNIPYIAVLNKIDLIKPHTETRRHGEHRENNEEQLCAFASLREKNGNNFLSVSAKTGFDIDLLKEKIASLAQTNEPQRRLVADLLKPNDFVILVIPIDKAAPKGRLILPQQQVIRDILETGCAAITVRESELHQLLLNMPITEKKPALVITDSQVFALVSQLVPQEIPLTSFSILFARYKGFLETAIESVTSLDNLKDGEKVLICEGCTHHRQCDDIGTFKIPGMIKNYTKKEINFSFCSGGDFPSDLSIYKLIIHCGCCMLNERGMLYRQSLAKKQNIPLTNYGIVIAHITGILKRSIEVFKLA
ncbi:MAG: [FeFe] hydrogenase H-cluster maturation GTPase HydF [Treponema sp.]|nr:[FeFe] hydrogenase H-cluster maturation GTPase HydF [Treponema sp.]